MSSLQIRNVPEGTVRSLKIRAAAAGMSLSEFALSALTATVAGPSLEELSERIRVRGAVEPSTRAADAVNDSRRTGCSIMLVIDASVLAEYLIGSALGRRAGEKMSAFADSLQVPHLAIAETISVFRSWSARGELADARARGALEDLRDFPALRDPTEPLLPRIWQLRHNLSSYDAHYVALAEALDAPLLTADVRISRASGPSVEIQLVSSCAEAAPTRPRV